MPLEQHQSRLDVHLLDDRVDGRLADTGDADLV
jgi:hypothetical protein